MGVPRLKSPGRVLRCSRLVRASGCGAAGASVGRLLAARTRKALPAPGWRFGTSRDFFRNQQVVLTDLDDTRLCMGASRTEVRQVDNDEIESFVI